MAVGFQSLGLGTVHHTFRPAQKPELNPNTGNPGTLEPAVGLQSWVNGC